MAFSLASPAFRSGGLIPIRHTCDGADLSPPLRWSDPPEGTKSFALVVDDPDAPTRTWVHWVLYNVPASVRELTEHAPAGGKVPSIGTQGVNDFGEVGYGGPCPPRGPAHRYFFKLYALDIEATLPARQTKSDLLEAIDGHILAQAELTGRFQRG